MVVVMETTLTEHVKDAGYEILFLLGGVLALSLHPTVRNQERIFQWVADSQGQREHLRRLKKKGLITTSEQEEKWVPRLTELGRAAFAGGRHPEDAWSRSWDGKWRLLTFDLPRSENRDRLRFRRWLLANHFGRLQGSVWISPDPVPVLEEVITIDRLDPSMVMVFEGEPAGSAGPREVAAIAWDFESINAAYRHYASTTTRVLKQVRRKPPTRTRLREILSKDRSAWWAAVRLDPLLPKPLHPAGYEGTGAWEIRCQLHEKLGEAIAETGTR